MAVRTYDPLTTETHRRAMENLTNEMATTLVRTSGSPVVVEAMDFSTCFLDNNIEHVAFAAYVLLHSGTSLLGVRAVVDSLGGRDPEPGDGWIVNDPHGGGAAHQGDVAIVMPTFYEGSHVGWAFTNMHLLDIGGSGISGFAPGAKEVYEEGLRFPPLKIIAGGEIIHTWEEFITANVRVAGTVLNDIRSMIASNRTGERKLGEVIERFGWEEHNEYNRINKDLTEAEFRRRIEALPDGSYETFDWVEYDGHGEDLLLWIRCQMDVEGSDLRFSFSGSPQVPAFVNSVPGAMYGMIMSAILVTLAYGDLPFNAGMWRPIEIDLGEPGTIVNSVPPAPVSCAHSEVGHRACKMVKDVLSQALALSEDEQLRSRVAAQAQDGFVLIPYSGLSQHGSPMVALYLENSVAIGSGGQSFMDGHDSYGTTPMAGCGMQDIESHEASDPVLFLWRTIPANTGGPGSFRGGQGMEQAFVVAYTDELRADTTASVARVPPGGFGGGLPGTGCGLDLALETEAMAMVERGELPGPEYFGGSWQAQPSKRVGFTLAKGAVARTFSGGGGGLGDPLMRDPALVAKDVRDGYVSVAHAEHVYGVVVKSESLELDAEATVRRRLEVRGERIGAPPEREAVAPEVPGMALKLDGGSWTCGYCGSELADQAENWRVAAVGSERGIAELYGETEMTIRERSIDPKVVVRLYHCPSCAGLLSADVALADAAEKGAPSLAANGVEGEGSGR